MSYDEEQKQYKQHIQYKQHTKPPKLKIKMYPTKNSVLNNEVFLPEVDNSYRKTLSNPYPLVETTKNHNIRVIEDKIALIDYHIHTLALEMETLNKEKFYIYKNNRIQNTQWVSTNSIFVFPLINNKYEIEYIRLNTLKDYYRYQKHNSKKYNIYSIRVSNFYDINRHHLKNFDFNIV